MASTLRIYSSYGTTWGSGHYPVSELYSRKALLIFTYLHLRKKVKQFQFSVELCSVNGDKNARHMVCQILKTALQTMKVQEKRMQLLEGNHPNPMSSLDEVETRLYWCSTLMYWRTVRIFGILVGLRRILKKLRRYGISGILSYGLLNTAYYLSTFLLVWFYFVPAPGKMGSFAAAERFLKLMAMVWAGSQVTKLIRAGGALALAPFVDRGLSWFTVKFKFQSQGKAFMAIVGFCFGLAIALFLIVTLLWA